MWFITPSTTTGCSSLGVVVMLRRSGRRVRVWLTMLRWVHPRAGKSVARVTRRRWTIGIMLRRETIAVGSVQLLRSTWWRAAATSAIESLSGYESLGLRGHRCEDTFLTETNAIATSSVFRVLESRAADLCCASDDASSFLPTEGYLPCACGSIYMLWQYAAWELTALLAAEAGLAEAGPGGIDPGEVDIGWMEREGTGRAAVDMGTARGGGWRPSRDGQV